MLPFRVAPAFGAPFVKINGETKRAARNTYVPNRLRSKMQTHRIFYVMGGNYLQGQALPQILRSPDVPWETIPEHLQDKTRPRFGNYAIGYRISNPNNPTSYVLDSQGRKISVYFNVDQEYGFYTIQRPVVDSDLVLDKSNLWNGERNYYVLDFDMGKHLGTITKSIILEIPPVQNLPRIKKLTLHKKKVFPDGTAGFERVTGELDTSTIKPEALFPQSKRSIKVTPSRTTILYPPFTVEEANEKTIFFVEARINGNTYADSSERHPTLGNPTFELKEVKLNSRLLVTFLWYHSGQTGPLSWNGLDNIHRELVEDPANSGQYILKLNPDYNGKVSPVEVTYSEN
ncbi:hypothetical protein [Porphyromonas cangingivalis]|nr:hypothetical protein [Porphyromonas cangingivalis]